MSFNLRVNAFVSLLICRKFPFFVGQNLGPFARTEICPRVKGRLEIFITLALVLPGSPCRFLTYLQWKKEPSKVEQWIQVLVVAQVVAAAVVVFVVVVVVVAVVVAAVGVAHN